jgi:hypothetical protein
VYGYYFDERGTLAKLAYTGTQTAGVIVIGEGIKRYYGESQISAVNALMTSDQIKRQDIERVIVENGRRQKRAKRIADAWTGGLLGGLYAYNAYRTPESLKTAKNSFLFLSANALALSGYNVYQLYSDKAANEALSLTITRESVGFALAF